MKACPEYKKTDLILLAKSNKLTRYSKLNKEDLCRLLGISTSKAIKNKVSKKDYESAQIVEKPVTPKNPVLDGNDRKNHPWLYGKIGEARRKALKVHSNPLLIGDILRDTKDVQDRFKGIEQIGAGGEGVVFAAYDMHAKKKVALKVVFDLVPDYLKTEKRFSDLDKKHRYTVQVYDQTVFVDLPPYARNAASPSARCIRLLVSSAELMKGDLRGYVKHYGTSLEVYKTCERETLAALNFIHRCGFSHNDVKPDNFLFADQDTIRVSDYGLVSKLGKSLHTIKKTGLCDKKEIPGSQNYWGYLQASRESKQGACQRIAKNDIEALANTLYELFVGPLPWSTLDDDLSPEGIRLRKELYAQKPHSMLQTVRDHVLALGYAAQAMTLNQVQLTM